MLSKEEISHIRKIETEIDNLYLSHKAMETPYSYAIQLILLTYELSSWMPIISGSHIPLKDIFEDSARIDDNKYSLTHSINWASKSHGKLGDKIIGNIDIENIKIIKEFFDLALAYHGAVSGFTMWNRKIANLTLTDKTTLNFQYPDDECSRDVLDRKLYINKVEEKVEDMLTKNPLVLQKQLMAVTKSVKKINENSISYSLRNVDYKRIMFYGEDIINAEFIPPDSWHFHKIYTKSFIRFWVALKLICMFHYTVIRYALSDLEFKYPLTSCVAIRAKSDWIRQITKWTGMSKELTEQILDYHIYDASHNKPDIVLTPFIQVTAKHLALAPTLIMTNNLGRNLLKHLAKNDKAEFDRNSNVFANNMIAEFSNSMNNLFFKVRPNIFIPTDNGKLPDIDILLIDKKTEQIMCCEFKWTIPPADPGEIRDKEDAEGHALDQLTSLKKYISENPEKVGTDLKIDFALNIHSHPISSKNKYKPLEFTV